MGADNTFKLKIVASNRVFYDGRAQTLVIPAIDGGEVGFLAQHNANAVFCGGIGPGAQNALAQAGIQLFGGISGPADAAVADYLAGKLRFDPNAHCDHHDHGEGHHCGEHHCGGHSCGQ